jgi:3-deoxy-D-manno-octulosonate 8-phosphate phosphatase (KDO 8-P phosphatase)
LILMDVDGVLTDGGITLIEGNREARTYDARDGVGLWLARAAGLRTGLISGRVSAAVARRAAELRIDEIHQRSQDKLGTYLGILKRRRLGDDQVCFIGDDLLDLPVLLRAGMPVAVADAHPEVRRRVPFVTGAPGGRGAVREVIDAILKAQGKWDGLLARFAGPAAGPEGGRAARRRARP